MCLWVDPSDFTVCCRRISQGNDHINFSVNLMILKWGYLTFCVCVFCLYVYVRMNVHICTLCVLCVNVCAWCKHSYARMHSCAHVCTHACAQARVCMCAIMCVYVHYISYFGLCVFVCICARACMCVCVCLSILEQK